MKTLSAYLFIYLIAFAAINAQGQTRSIDSLKKNLIILKEDTNKVKTLNYISEKFWRRGEYQNAIVYGEQARALAEKLLAAENDPALIKIYKKKLSESNNNIGISNNYLGNYPAALKNYLNAQKLDEEISYKPGIANCYTNISILYFNQENYIAALENAKAGLKLYLELKNMDRGISSSYNNIGNAYVALKNYPEALKNYSISLQIRQQGGDRHGTASSYNNIGIVYERQRNYPKALENYLAGLKLREEDKDDGGIAGSYINLGSFFNIQHKYAEAKPYLDKGLKLAEKMQDVEMIKECYGALSVLDSANGDLKSAFKNYKNYIANRDNLNNEENTKKTIQSQMQYDFDKKISADSIKNAEKVKQENLKHEAEIKQQKLYTYGGIIGFLLTLIVAGISFRANREKQKANTTITEQKILAEQKQKEILDSIHYAKRIQQSLLPTEKYIERNIERLKK